MPYIIDAYWTIYMGKMSLYLHREKERERLRELGERKENYFVCACAHTFYGLTKFNKHKKLNRLPNKY